MEAAVQESPKLTLAEGMDPALGKKYVVLHSGVGPNWQKGDVVPGINLFSDERHNVQTLRKVLNRATGKFEHVVIEERTMNPGETVAGLNRLISLRVIRPATEFECTLSKVELENQADRHEISSNEQKIADQQKELDELRRQIAAVQERNVMAAAVTQTKEAIVNAKRAEALPQPATPQPPPGSGQPSPRKTATSVD